MRLESRLASEHVLFAIAKMAFIPPPQGASARSGRTEREKSDWAKPTRGLGRWHRIFLSLRHPSSSSQNYEQSSKYVVKARSFLGLDIVCVGPVADSVMLSHSLTKWVTFYRITKPRSLRSRPCYYETSPSLYFTVSRRCR